MIQLLLKIKLLKMVLMMNFSMYFVMKYDVQRLMVIKLQHIRERNTFKISQKHEQCSQILVKK